MALFELITPEHSRMHYFRDYHTIGRRTDSVDTVLKFPHISKLHAIVEWREPNWLLKDVSRNGVKLNNKIIPAQKAVVLCEDDVIDFGGMGEAKIKIVSLNAPKPMLVSERSINETIDITESTLLPNEESPELALYLCPDRHQWFVENIDKGDEKGPYDHGDRINIGGSHWRFFLVSEDSTTTEFASNNRTLDEVLFRFDLSQDEENTDLTIFDKGNEIEIGERSHNYLLVHLLRYKKRYPDSGGWIHTHVLMKELGLEETHLNIQIFRARKQIAKALPNFSGHSKLIERRRGSIRVGIALFEIYKEGVKEI